MGAKVLEQSIKFQGRENDRTVRLIQRDKIETFPHGF
jgi:hypothetical protein